MDTCPPEMYCPKHDIPRRQAFRNGKPNGWRCQACANESYRRVPAERRRVYNKAYKRSLRPRVLTYLGGACAHCGHTDPRLLQVDHVNGGGNEERRVRSTPSILASILRGAREGEFQLLCANCHLLKELAPVPA